MTSAGRIEQAQPGRRFLIAVGVGNYRAQDIVGLPGVEADVRRVRQLLEPMGYQCVLTDLAHDPTRAALAEGIEEWALETDLGPKDVVVVYFAGHGVHELDRHYLLCADSRRGRSMTALAAEDLARALVMSDVGHLLVILDTCYSAAGAADISRLALDLANLHRGRAANRWHLASARAVDRAKENLFVDALSEVLAHPRHGATQQYVSVREVTERVNEHFKIHRPSLQEARLTNGELDGQDPFFPSALFLPGLPVDGIDLASLAVLRRRHHGHFGPRSRGLEHVGDRGDYFTGRTHALLELTTFLTTPSDSHDRRARVVTGDPGSGKSALLGRVLALTDPHTPHPEVQTFMGAGQPTVFPSVVTLHARRAVLEDLAADLASALRLPSPAARDDVLTALAGRTTPVAIVVDSLDEAGTAGDPHEAARIARELLQPLSTLLPVRLVIGTRRPQIPSLGHAVHVLDMDTPAYVAETDIAAYARALLEDAQDRDSRSPYRHRPELTATIADGIATRAGSSYLVARMTARALVHGQITIDTTQPGWRDRLPSDAKEAFAAYLDRFGPDRHKVERLLRPLAYAQGAGLPWSTLWAPLAEALSGLPCPQEDLDWLHHQAGAYIIETPTPDGSAYRLFHETMAEHLRRPGREREDHATIAHTLTALIRKDESSGVNDWPAAHPYIRRHAATHAASGGTLPTLLNDPEYLVHAHPGTLLSALYTISGPERPPVADIYRASADVHSGLTPTERRDILAIDAARYQHTHLATRLARTRPWTPRWATGTLVHPALRTTLTSHTEEVTAVAVAQISGRPHAITASDDQTIRVWDLTNGTHHATPTGHTEEVTAVAVAQISGIPHAITASIDGTVRVWDLDASTHRTTFNAHTDELTTVAVTQIDGIPHAITASIDGTVRVWDLDASTHRTTITGHNSWVNAVTVAQIDGRPHCLTASDDHTVRVWDLTNGTHRTTLTGHTEGVNAVTVAQIDEAPHAITASHDHTVRVWDLTNDTHRTTLTGHNSAVNAVAVTQINGRPHCLTASDDHTVRVWDLTNGTHRTTLTGHTEGVNAVTVAQIDGRPHCLTASDDHTVRVWDLTNGTHRTTLTGHTEGVNAVTVAQIDEAPHAITASHDHTVRVWDLTNDTHRTTLTGHNSAVNAVAVTQINGRPHAITTSNEWAVRVWDLDAGTHRTTLTGHNSAVNAVAVTQINGRPHCLTASDDHTVRVWDLTNGTHRTTLTGANIGVNAVAVAELDGRPHAITATQVGPLWVWDLDDGTHRSILTSHNSWVRAVALTQIKGIPHAVAASDDGTVRVWDLTNGTHRTILTGHKFRVNAMTVAQLNGNPHCLTTGGDQTIRVWDLTNGTHRTTLTGHTDEVNAVTVTQINGRPHALTTGDDKTVRVWDLLANRAVYVLSQPLPGRAITTYGDSIVLGMANEVVMLQRSSTRST